MRCTQDTLDPTWNFRCELENKDQDVSMVLGVFDSDVSAAKEAEQTEKLKKKKNTREYEVGTDPRLKRTLAVLAGEIELCMEQSAKYKVCTAPPNRIPEYASLAFWRQVMTGRPCDGTTSWPGAVALTRACGCEGNTQLSVDEVPFSEVMMEYMIRESPPGKPPSTFKKFKLGVLSIIEEETKRGLNRLPYTTPEEEEDKPTEEAPYVPLST